MMADSSTAHSAQSLLAYWKGFDLPNVQKELDETATDLANRQDESDASRKKLVDQSRDFKKNATEEVRKGATSLLKSFQSEVDSLSKRSKAAEAAFLDLYKKIVESPDPVPALDAAAQWQKKAQRVTDLEVENANFRETLDQYNLEFAEVKNQEVTIRQLKEKIKNYEDHIEKEVDDKVKEKEATLQRFFQDRERQLQEAGGILSMKLQEAERRSEALQSSLTAAQQELFSLRARADDTRDARATEVEMVVADLERANQRAETAEREAQALKDDIENLKANSKKAAQVSEENSKEDFARQLAAMELELTAKDKQIRQLLDEVKQMNLRLAESSTHFEEQEKRMRQEIQEKSRALQILEGRLNSQADYEEIKKELNIMKSIEFGSEEGKSEASEGGKALEVLLLEKNKTLQAEKTALTVARKELEGNPSTGDVTTGQFPSVTPSNSGSFQHVIDALGCLVGAELVSAYAKTQSEENRLKKEMKQAQMESTPSMKTSTPSMKSGPIAARKSINRFHRSIEAASGSGSVKLEPEMAPEGRIGPVELTECGPVDQGDIETVLKKHELFDFDQAIREGMPKDLAELAVCEQLQGFVQGSVTRMGETPLNTVEIATHCRQLLAMYNLGQRLFAKTVLNQSQGSLSELLSKPRPWHRLTEKGREAFRKIHAWVSDERPIVLLRTLSPRRTYNPGAKDEVPPVNLSCVSTASRTLPADATETIMQCLKEAQQAAAVEHQQSRNSQSQHRFMTMTSSLPEQKHIRPISVASSTTSDQTTSRMSANNRWRHDDIPKEMIFEIYERELHKLKEQEQSLCQELRGRSGGHRSSGGHQTVIRPSSVTKREPMDVQRVTPSTPSAQLTRRESNSRDRSETPSTPSAQLTRRESNSRDRIETPSTPSAQLMRESDSRDSTPYPVPSTRESPQQQPVSGTRALKAILPAITQEQFEKYNDVVTEDLVKTVKDFLTQQSISQRLFGENILGLSQGSVSDLLARPKPWHLLTQKGREPFIRMKMFLEDEEAIESLKNKKTSSSSPGPLAIAVSKTEQSSTTASPCNSVSNGAQVPSTPLTNFEDDCSNNSVNSESSPLDKPKVGDLDTEDIAEQVKEILHTHGIGQKLFGEAVLGVSQGTVSELLAKPKIWHLLSLRGREPYIRMHWWLQDPDKVDNLQEYGASRAGAQKNTTKRPYDVMNSEWNSSGAAGSIFGPTPYKKPRSLITDQQKEALRFAFEHEPYPSSKTVDFLSEELNLSARTVINWFHNHRMRIKLQNPAGGMDSMGLDYFETDRAVSDQQVSSSDSPSTSTSFINNNGSLGQVNSYAKNLQDLISMLSSAEEQNGCQEEGAGIMKTVKEEPLDLDPSEPISEMAESSSSRRDCRKSLLEKLEQSVNQSDLDWNAGLREEALSKLSHHVNRSESSSWEF